MSISLICFKKVHAYSKYALLTVYFCDHLKPPFSLHVDDDKYSFIIFLKHVKNQL